MQKIPLIKPQINGKVLCNVVLEVAKSGILTKGKYVNTFQDKLQQYLKTDYALATTSATTALHLGLLVGNIKAGDEVLVSDYSFPASGNVVAQIGAKPVFVDINLIDFNMDIDDLKKKITKKSKAIMVVHAFGYPANMSEIMKIAKKHHLFVIEDAACAIGSQYKEKFCGTWGDVGCFSFHPRKVITTGEGGAIVTNNKKIAERLEILRNHGGIQGKDGQEFVEIGYNYRMSELQAAMGLEQLRRAKQIIKRRQEIAKKYLKLLKNIQSIQLPREPENGEFNFQSFVVFLDRNIDRGQVIQKMATRGIETTIGTYAMHAQKSFSKFGYKPGDLINSFFAYRHALTLPLYEGLTEENLNFIANTLSLVIQEEK